MSPTCTAEFDYGVPMLARMALKRQSGYRSLGYEVAAR